MIGPCVSVVIPTYNRAKQLPRALDSVISQTFDDWEIILVDDGSTDATAAVVSRYQRKLGARLHCVTQSNRGASRSRNRGIDLSRGRFIAFLDSDDEYLPQKLARQTALFEQCPDLGLVYSDFSYLDVAGVFYRSALNERHPMAGKVERESVAPGLYRCIGKLTDALIRGYFICTITGMVKRDVLGSSIRFPEDQVFAEEWLFYLRVAHRCLAGFVDEPLALYRHQEGSLARTDRRANARQYRRLLEVIHAEFGPVNGRYRKTTRHHLGLLGRQLGYTAYREHRYDAAFHHFRDALRYEVDLRTVYHAAISWLAGMNHQGTKRTRMVEGLPGEHAAPTNAKDAQDASIAVR